jgi:CTP-dependent riboflavin kinase
MNKTEVKIKGALTAGLGQGVFFTQLDWVKRQCRDKLGFIPYGGTLNIVVGEDSLEATTALKNEAGIDIIADTPDYCPARVVPVEVGGQKAAVILPDAAGYTVDIHGPETLEIIAPIRLKDALGIRDGDEVTISYTPGRKL